MGRRALWAGLAHGRGRLCLLYLCLLLELFFVSSEGIKADRPLVLE